MNTERKKKRHLGASEITAVVLSGSDDAVILVSSLSIPSLKPGSPSAPLTPLSHPPHLLIG